MAKRTKHIRGKPVVASESEIERAVVFGRRHETLGFEIKELTGIPYPFLTDGQWADLQELSGLPDYTRVEVNFALRRYWRSFTNDLVAKETPGQIANVRKQLQQVIGLLFELSDNPDLFKRQIIYFDQSAMEQRQQLLQTCYQMDRTDTLLSFAEERLEAKQGKPSYGPIYELNRYWSDMDLLNEPSRSAVQTITRLEMLLNRFS